MRYGFLVALMGLVLSAGSAVGQSSTAPPDDTAAITGKLDRILTQQEQILQQLDAMDKQLKIITVRASQKH